MRPLRYSINITLDGCCDHTVGIPNEDTYRNVNNNFVNADALLFGRTVYEMMESTWRPAAPAGSRPAWVDSFAQLIGETKKYVVSSTLTKVDWNAELVRGDLFEFVQKLKQQPGKGILTGGVTLPLALAELGLIDEYEFVLQPRIAGHGPTLFDGLAKIVDLKLVDRRDFSGGIIALRYEPKR